jgi:hypothetical protein
MLKEIIDFTSFSIVLYKENVKGISNILTEFCPVLNCASIVSNYKKQIDVFYATCGLDLIRSCLKVIKSFRYAYRSNKKKKHFINCVRMHSYIVSQYMRNQDMPTSTCKVNDSVYIFCKRVAKKYGIGYNMFDDCSL